MGSKLADYVRRGAERLDVKKPGWFRYIDIDELEMADCKKCVLGQLYQDFNTGLIKVCSPEIPDGVINGEAFGFDFLIDEKDTEEEITALWLEEIERRLADA